MFTTDNAINIPAFCDNCGAAFESGIVIENCRNLQLSGNRSGPCPRCGSMGTVIDGVFNIVGNVIEIISAPDKTKDSLEKLSHILKVAAKEKQSAEKIAIEIKKEAPELSELTRYIPKNSNELVAWLTLILAALTYMKDMNEDKMPSVNIIINQAIERSVQPHNYYPFNNMKTKPS